MVGGLSRVLAYLGAMLAHFGAMLVYLEGNLGLSWELCWPILGTTLAHLETIVTILRLCRAILNHKIRKKGTVEYTVKYRIFKRLRPTAVQGPNYVGLFCGYVGLC